MIEIQYYQSTIPRIEPAKKEPWVEALRSGKREQGQRMLKTPDGKFCCLGVYCEINGVPEASEVRMVRLYDGAESTLTKIPVFGKNAAQWSHMTIPIGYEIPPQNSFDPGLYGGEIIFFCDTPSTDYMISVGADSKYVKQYSLPELNDSGFTFAQIADIIDYFL